jgi:outer membrane protein assembly factor BamB
MKSSPLLPLLALLAGGLASGCWLALGIEDLSGERLQTEAGGGTGPCSPGATATCANVEWAKIYGDKESQSSTSIAVDSAGNILLVGTYHGQIDFGGQSQTSAGGQDIFVAKLSPDGEFRWSRPVGDAANQYATGVAADGSDNVIVLGHFDGYADFSGGPVMSAGLNDIVVAKLSSDGNPIFTKRFGSPAEERSYSLAIDPLDNVLIAGFAAGDIDFGGPALMGANGLVFAKLSGSGDHIWSRRFSTDGPDLLEPIHIAADPSGGVVFTGSFGGSIYLDNVVEMTGPEDRDLLVAKLSPTGAVLWSEALGDGNLQYGKSVAVDGEGNVFVATDFFGQVDVAGQMLTSAGSSDVLLLKLSPSGEVLWGKRFGDASAQTVSGIALDGSGNILLAGAFKGTIDFGGGPLESAGADDIFVVKLNASGEHRFSRRFGGPNAQAATALAVDRSEYPVVAGDLFGDTDFGAGLLTSAGADDVFVLKLSP